VKAQQADLAEIFAKHVLGRPGFFSGKDARDLYTLDPISDAGPSLSIIGTRTVSLTCGSCPPPPPTS
jgi:hypothetical protein